MFPLAKESIKDNLTKDDIQFIRRLAKKIHDSGFVTPFLLTFTEADDQRFWEMESVGILGKLELRESK